ncbi:MAG: LuxR C-terminal-related transcriptional regulator [Thermoanaerobaculia bacterium]|nr:LuxR C-terminal-related transcriptional regulator [Thermoanaerobaculia bacterium]
MHPTASNEAHGIRPEQRDQLRRSYDLLSKREQEVLRGVAYGYTNREIAEHLGVSVKSVETYRHRLSDKLELGSRAELVRFALDLGLLCPESDGLPGQAALR